MRQESCSYPSVSIMMNPTLLARHLLRARRSYSWLLSLGALREWEYPYSGRRMALQSVVNAQQSGRSLRHACGTGTHLRRNCWKQEVQGLPQMRRRRARASLAPCAGAWTPHSPSIARVGLFPYLVRIFYLSGIAERHRRAIAECLAGAKRIRSPVRPYSLSFDLTHGPYAPAVVSGGKCLYPPNYPHATGIIPLTSPSPLRANTRDQLYGSYLFHFTKWLRSTRYIA